MIPIKFPPNISPTPRSANVNNADSFYLSLFVLSYKSSELFIVLVINVIKIDPKIV